MIAESTDRVVRLLLVGAFIYSVGFVAGITLGLHTGFVSASGLPHVTSLSERTFTVSPSKLVLHNMLNILLLTLGFVSFGAITTLVGLQNGFVHGIIVGTMLVELGSTQRVLLLFLPHAMLELSAIFVGIASGLYLPINAVRYVRKSQSYLLTETDITTVVKLAVTAQILVVLSSLVEYYVTMSLI